MRWPRAALAARAIRAAEGQPFGEALAETETEAAWLAVNSQACTQAARLRLDPCNIVIARW
ncbi:MAG TPA: hypothetical protein VIC29_16235 [Steroidobacteraceae bacterium]